MRKSPDLHAKDHKNHVMIGHDDGLWVSLPDSNNVYKWSKVPTDSKKLYEKLTKKSFEFDLAGFGKNLKKTTNALSSVGVELLYYEVAYSELYAYLSDSPEEHASIDRKTNVYMNDNGFYQRYQASDDMRVSKHKYVLFGLDIDIMRDRGLKRKSCTLYAWIEAGIKPLPETIANSVESILSKRFSDRSVKVKKDKYMTRFEIK